MANASRSRQAPTGQWTSLPLSPAIAPPYYDEGRPPLGRYDNARETPDPSRNEPEEWISMPLQPWSVGLFIAIAISLIIAIITLLIVSLRNDGFATIGAARSAYGATSHSLFFFYGNQGGTTRTIPFAQITKTSDNV